MRVAVLLLCSLGLSAAANVGINVHQQADQQWVARQRDLLQLFVNVHQPSYTPQELTFANSFTFQQQLEKTTNQYAVRQFQAAYKQGYLARGDLFNYFNPTHLQQAIKLFDLFYFAEDYDTFYQAACWARNYINEGMFVYTFSVAIFNRKDTQGMTIPPISEVYPYLYLHTRAVQKSQFYKQQGVKQATFQSNNTDNWAYFYQQRYSRQQAPTEYPFNSEVFFPFMDDRSYHQAFYNRETRLSYFWEDIFMNQQFAYEQLKNPAWFTVQKYPTRQIQKSGIQNSGEGFYYYLHQIIARYNLERYANDFPVVMPFQFDQEIKTGYHPMVQFLNGEMMPARPDNRPFIYANDYEFRTFKTMDRRFADVIDSGEVYVSDGTKVKLTNEDGLKVLGNLILNNGYSVNSNYYGALNGFYGYLDQCRRVVASVVDSDNTYYTMPTAIEMDQTAMRDPAFYQCVSKVLDYFRYYKNHLKSYNQDQLFFNGVKVQSFTAEKLITYFDYAEIDMFNNINYQQGETADKFAYKSQQLQLNYKPFNFQIQVNSESNADAIVRVFIGPKYDMQGKAYTLDQARHQFVEFDRFVYKLKSGQNTIQRGSQESTFFTETAPKTRQLFEHLQQAQEGGQAFYYNQYLGQMTATFPQNLLLPRGSREGQEYVIAVTVNPFQGAQEFAGMPFDNRGQGFPFDRVVRADLFVQAPNVYFQTVKIFFKTAQEINAL